MWHGILKAHEIKLLDVDGSVIWQRTNLKNLLHNDGENFILSVLFGGLPTPGFFYLGLDNRSVINSYDTMTAVRGANEPTINGYSRQPVASSGNFTIALNQESHYEADGPIITFRATGGSWGPVQNLFLTNAADYSGFLISSMSLGQSVTVSAGQSISMKYGMSLRENCT